MDRLRFIALLGVLVVCAGCIRSLHPLYNEKDVVFEPQLIGEWVEGSDSWTFSRAGDKAYRLAIVDGDGTGVFRAHLARIKGHLFLDLFPEEPEFARDTSDFYVWHLFRVHTFAHVKQIEPTLQISYPDPEWFKKFIARNPEALRHETTRDEIILTASTKELQTFWLKHLDAFGEPTDMKRRTIAVPQQQP